MTIQPLQAPWQPQRHERFGNLCGRSAPLQRAFALLECAAECHAVVLLAGESGTGKSAAAESIHQTSRHRRDPFVIVDCSSGSAEAALEQPASPLGTLVLDHVGELSPPAQARLFRLLEREPRRIIATTQRDLRAEVRARRFRRDLYYWLAVIEVRLPPLRERREDLALLVPEILARHAPAAVALVDDEYLAELGRHPWPGNVRELENHLERCLALGERVAVAQR